MAYTIRPYKESDTLAKLRQNLSETQAKKPAYTSRWKDELESTLGQMNSHKPFTYDPESDPMYGAYRDLYVQGGRRAMEDTMGKAAALTGGYGNSYAQQVGQQAYDGYLQGLGEKLPELYGLALNTYTREEDALKNRYQALGDQEDREYKQYLDGLNSWMAEREYLSGRMDSQQDFDYQLSRDQEKDQQWLAEFEYQAWKDAQSANTGGKQSSGGGGKSSGSAKAPSKQSSGGDGKSSETGNGSNLEANLAWTRDSESSDDVKRRQIKATVQEAVDLGEITSDEGKRLVEKYSPKSSVPAPKKNVPAPKKNVPVPKNAEGSSGSGSKSTGSGRKSGGSGARR